MVHRFLRIKRIVTILCLLGSIVWISACGKDDGGVAERLSGPEADSALPMRIDATVTPTDSRTPFENESTPFPEESPSPLPDIDEFAKEDPPAGEDDVAEGEDERSEFETRLNLLTPTPQAPREQASSSLSGEDVEEAKIIVTPTISISPTPSPEPDVTPIPESTNDTTLQVEPTATPEISQKTVSQNEGSEDKDKQATEKTPAKDSSKKTSEATSRKSPEKNVRADIRMDKLVVCSALSNRTPSGVAEQFSFSKVKKVYTWMKVSGATPPMRLKHRYYREGKFVASVSLRIKYPSMRTWSQKSFKGPESQGQWKVLVTTEDEKTILAEREFTLVP